jgi:hypothetical protein
MSLYERYKDEAEFRDEFIKPLLVRLGFVGISQEHGVAEFGKDFVFSELDAFGKLRNMVVQAKHKEKIDQGQIIDDLVRQIEESFHVAYHLPSSPGEERIVSAVYVFNSGDITNGAKTSIRNRLHLRPLAANVSFFGGEQLEMLANTVAHRNSQRVRIRLTALFGQICCNINIWKQVLQLAEQTTETARDVRGSMYHAIESWLSEPAIPQLRIADDLLLLWQQAKIIDSLAAGSAFQKTPSGEHDRGLLVSLCKQTSERATSICQRILLTLNSIPA